MKKKFILITLWFFFFTAIDGAAVNDGGTFRSKWWNYYNRGIEYSEKADWTNSISDLKKAVSMRTRDQRMARTYGMHFIDYFPHRELGIVYFSAGELDKAVNELEESIRSEESAKAVYYLNKARKIILLNQKDRQANPPLITIESPVHGSALKGLSVKAKGKTSGAGLIAKILINNNPYRFDLAKEDIEFEKELSVDDGENMIVVTAEDLLGHRSKKTIAVFVDREGPAINILDILMEERDGEKFVRITGEINDSTGIRNILLGDKAIKIDDLKTYEFNISIPLPLTPSRKGRGEFFQTPTSLTEGSPDIPSSLMEGSPNRPSPLTGEGKGGGVGIVVIHASDSLDNETRAELDIEKEITAFNKNSATVLLAFNGDNIFSSDRQPPVISLKDTADVPVVFVDKYYVEGEVFDNNLVEKIFVNNKEVAAKKGKKMFFSKIVKLTEGDNRIVVDAYDPSDNKATSAFTVKRNIPAVMQAGSRMSVSVLPFESRQRDAGLTQLAYEQLTGSFVEQKRFSVIERAKLEQVLLEQKLTREKLTDPEHSIRVGRLMSAETILSTSINETPKSIEVISRVINTETSEVMEVKDVFTEDKSLASIKELMDGLASKIAGSFPIVEGMVINKGGSREIYSDLGAPAKIRRNTGVIFYRKGREIKHPVTGRSLGWDTIKLGEGRIEDIQKDFSKIRLLEKPGSQDINVKDMMITK
ncbi:MAG: hypothetical protein HZA10_08680 [Nitrospirae bacterium]|nr:hypothetical protein [Nitrospirota bacterium]